MHPWDAALFSDSTNGNGNCWSVSLTYLAATVGIELQMPNR